MTSNSSPHSPIAIIGLGCRYPDARSPKELWENVLARRQSFRRMPDERLPLSEYWDPDKSAPDKTYGKRAAVIDGFNFDWARRLIPKQVFEQTDITHWLALDVALQALTDAGYEPKELPRDRTGVIIGNTLTGEQQRSHLLRGRWPFVRKTIRAAGIKKGLDGATLEELVAETETIYKSFFPAPNEDTLAGALANTIAGRICNYMDLRGGGYTVDGACSSSLLSVATASNALCAGDIDVALAGGVDVSLDAFELVGFAKVGALSDSEMKVYDRAGNGFLPGEGCGFIVMKRLADAERDGDYVYAVLNGWGISSDGKGGITAPTAAGQALALRRAYERAGYSAHQLDFVEGHGTGTSVGDPIELTGISNTIDSFGEAEPHRCGVTSFKSLVGHTKAAAGVGGLLKAVAAVNRRVIPPTAGCDEPHEVFNDKAKNLYPVRRGTCHDASRTLTAGVSAMGFGGINSHVTLTSGGAPSRDLEPTLDERALLASKQETELFVLAEASTEALSNRVSELLKLADGMSIGEMPDLAVELAQKLDQAAPVRAAIVASSPEDLHKRLEHLLAAAAKAPVGEEGYTFSTPDRRLMLTLGASSPRIGFLFPGQGSQRLNMAAVLVERFDWARELVSEADAWLEEVGVRPVSPFIFRDTERDLSGEQQKQWMHALTQTEVAQPAICLASLLWLRFLNQLGLKPAAVGGHSLGELTAFYAAGALDEKSVLQLAALRGKLMGEVPVEGSMASLVCQPDEARALLDRIDGYVVIANINSASQTVVSGDRAAIAATVDLASKNGIRARELPVSAAFHSAHFAETVTALRQTPVLRGTGTPTDARLYSTMTGTVLEGEVELADHFGEQVVQPVNFQAVARLASDECDVLVEVGPGAVLSGLSNETAGIDGTVCLPIESKAGRDRDLNSALGYLFTRGAELDLVKLWDQRLIRKFKSAAELSFFVNPCEQDLIEPAAKTGVTSSESAEDGTPPPATAEQRPRSEPVTAIRPAAPRLEMQKHESVRPGASSTPAYVDTRAVLLDAIHKQTGFPIDMLTDDLRMIDDLHMDSIKTVQVVVDVAVAIGYAGDFDPAAISNATLAEIVQELESRIATANEGRSGSLSPTRAAEIAKHYPGWTRNFVMRWQDAPLPEAPESFWKGRSVCILDDGSKAATELWETTRKQGAEVNAVPASATADIDAEVVVAVLSDEAMGADARQRFESVTELLASIAAGLPLSTSSERPQTIVFLQRRSPQSDFLDWGYDGFAAALHLERKGLRFRVVTLDESADGDRLCEVVAREVETDTRYDAARYFGKTRRIARPQILPNNALTRRPRQLDSSDVVLVTGGARGITAECALALARETGAQMILAGSSPSPADAPDSPNGAEIQKTLDRFANEGLSADYVQCDLTEPSQVAALVAAARRRTGRVSAVIHGAAINRPERAHKVSAEDARDEISPKLIGALNLFEALKKDPPAIFCAFTSVIGVTGMPNNAWYAFANQALDRSLGLFASSNPDTDAVSMAFSIWEEVGMGANLGSLEGLAALGTDSIPLQEGIRRFLDLFTKDPGDRQVIVTGRLGGIDTWRPEFPALPKGTRFLEDVRFFQPGVELVTRSHLSLERDAYLGDHEYEDTYLFPTVFGVEAMAQAVAYALGRPELSRVTLNDLDLSRPLPVHPERGLEIEVYAHVLETDSAAVSVKTGIRCDQSGFAHDHFSATYALGVQSAPNERPNVASLGSSPSCQVDPKEDLYGPVLFQGPRFQRIGDLQRLDREVCDFESEERETQEFVLGDPFARDALLQSLQLCAVPDQCLPVGVSRWHISSANDCVPRRRRNRATITDRPVDEYVGHIVSEDENGVVLEELFDYRAKILKRRADWPTAEQLAARHTRETEQTSVEWSTSQAYDTIQGADAVHTDLKVTEQAHRVQTRSNYGYQNQDAFTFRFPLTAQDSASATRSLYFTRFFKWMGKMREVCGLNTPGAYVRILDMLRSNEITTATNAFETRILRTPRCNDIIEGRLWVERASSADCDAVCEWWAVPFAPNEGEAQMFGWSHMTISPVKVLPSGAVRATTWPGYFHGFLELMGPRGDGVPRAPGDPYDYGACRFREISGPRAAGILLANEVFDTSFEDGNVVGNIYFASYGVWQGRVRDRFFYDVCPEAFTGLPDSELVCTNFRMTQLREAMPFDRVRVEMRLMALYDCAADLTFHYFRVAPDGSETKLAVGEHTAAWASPAATTQPDLRPWPPQILVALTERAGERQHLAS